MRHRLRVRRCPLAGRVRSGRVCVVSRSRLSCLERSESGRPRDGRTLSHVDAAIGHGLDPRIPGALLITHVLGFWRRPRLTIEASRLCYRVRAPGCCSRSWAWSPTRSGRCLVDEDGVAGVVCFDDAGMGPGGEVDADLVAASEDVRLAGGHGPALVGLGAGSFADVLPSSRGQS